MTKIRKNKSPKKYAHRSELSAQIEKKQVGRFLMPDAPPRKTKKQGSNSPEWMPCPLVPGTPAVPPPRIPQPWELKKRKITPEKSSPCRYTDSADDTVPDVKDAVSSSSPCQSPVKRTSPSPSKVHKKNSRSKDVSKQVGHFMMPDAPPRKTKKQGSNSPEWMPCPLVPGTPAVPPPRIPQPWELKKRNAVPDVKDTVSSSSPCQSPVKRTPPSPSKVHKKKSRSKDVSNYQQVDCKVKQVGHFMMPDAPPRKTKKQGSNSPEWIPCPLAPGTPKVPPPRILQPWELNKRKITPEKSGPCWYIHPDDDTVPHVEDPVSSSSACETPDKSDLPSTSEIRMFTPTTETTTPEDISNYQLVDCKLEVVDYSDPASLMPDAPSLAESPNSVPLMPNPASPMPDAPSLAESPISVPPTPNLLFDNNEDIDIEILQWESTIGHNPGSDDDDVEYEDIDLIDLPIIIGPSNNVTLPGLDDHDVSPNVSEAIEVLDKADDAALRDLATEDMLKFDWSFDPSVFTGQREVFTGIPGPTFNIEGLSPFQIFTKFWDEKIIALIVRETNQYAEGLKNNPNLANHAAIKNWFPLTAEELLVFFSIIMFQSLIPIPVELEYWRPRFDFLKIGRFGDIMSFHRFQLIKRCLHFVDNLKISSSTNAPHKLAKIMPIIEHLNDKFSALYLPGQIISVDESLLLWKGRLSFAQLIKTKAARVGIKSYELCESKTGYLWKMKLYVGKEQDMPQEGGKGQDMPQEGSKGHDMPQEGSKGQDMPQEGSKRQDMPQEGGKVDEPKREGASSKIVLELVRPLLNLGHTLVMDSFYNSPLLSRTLKKLKTDTMGTLRLNRAFVPVSLKGKIMKPGEVAFSQTRDMTVVVCRDSNLVSLISTYHPAEVGGKEKHGNYHYKPQVVLDYNRFMERIDKKDQLLRAFPVERVRNLVWYKKLFRRLLNVSILNAHIIFGSAGTRWSSREFRGYLADEILTKFRPLKPASTKSVAPPSAIHFPKKNEKKKARCKLCASNNKETRTVWQCELCNISLCMPECFKQYHVQNKKV